MAFLFIKSLSHRSPMEHETKKYTKRRTIKHHPATATGGVWHLKPSQEHWLSFSQTHAPAHTSPLSIYPAVCCCFYYTRAPQSQTSRKYLKCDEYIYTGVICSNSNDCSSIDDVQKEWSNLDWFKVDDFSLSLSLPIADCLEIKIVMRFSQ